MFLFHDKVTRGDKIWIKIWLIVLLKDDACRGPTLSHDFPLLLYQEIRFNCPKICNQTVKSIKIIQIRRTIVEINQGLSNFPKFIQRFPRVSTTFLQNVTILSSRGLFPGSLKRILMPKKIGSQSLLLFFNFRERAPCVF
jgi:hypothetical protein